MKILVTGGAGCIGSDLAEALAARGDHVRVVDNLSSGKSKHIAALRDKPEVEFVEGDLEHPALVDAVMSGVEMVYHLAANPDVKFAPGDPARKAARSSTSGTIVVNPA